MTPTHQLFLEKRKAPSYSSLHQRRKCVPDSMHTIDFKPLFAPLRLKIARLVMHSDAFFGAGSLCYFCHRTTSTSHRVHLPVTQSLTHICSMLVSQNLAPSSSSGQRESGPRKTTLEAATTKSCWGGQQWAVQGPAARGLNQSRYVKPTNAIRHILR